MFLLIYRISVLIIEETRFRRKNMDNQNNNNKGPKRGKQGLSVILLTTLITALLVLGLYQFMQDSTSKEIPYSKFLKMVDNGEVEKVTIDSDKLIITPKESKKSSDSEGSGSVFGNGQQFRELHTIPALWR